MGPEYVAIALTACISALTGGSWLANRIMDRQKERVEEAFSYISAQQGPIDCLQGVFKQLPIAYVL